MVNDFLELLLFGTPSQELQHFLITELTDRGVKKLGESMVTYYKTIRELLSTHLLQ